ncbi:serine/threonine protein kinase [Haliangium ochraceum]|uniref:Serine/threonine protein kinase n=1 Tax=Haliangium ochraceum (strain DSM 14365 / JCM 11303 / SMP-2) TaxID=502025 RepID=D0LU31_HALO1|nr:serine/threonine-protein kinase [Haliangium ochraceum]ACY17395.1 serine/threonine protein kinase [Haliangium ochraceum DSM 14365]
MSKSKLGQIPDPLEVGARLMDRYCILERVSAGGHSVVYRGEDERLHRPVCIKVFHRVKSFDGPYKTAYEHFVQEAFALSKLTHPNTLRIYDFGHLEKSDAEGGSGAPFQVSEFMTDGTLWSQVRAKGPMGAVESARIATALGGALGEAHESGIIHRDIKPHNILFTAAGRSLVVKLADFGIAKALPTEAADLRNRADDTSVVVGRPFLMYSPWWAAPEQLAGMPVGTEADVFALALSIIYMVTGNVVFRENDPIKAYEQRKSGPAFVEAACVGAGLSHAVIDLLARACRFEADERFNDAETFALELAAGLRKPGPTAQISSVPEPRAPQHRTSDRYATDVEPHEQATNESSGPMPEQQPPPYLQPVPPPAEPGWPEAARSAPPPQRLHVSEQPQFAAERRIHFVPAPQGEATVSCLDNRARLRIAFVPGASGLCVHLRGLTCFLAPEGGRPSSAMLFENDGFGYLVQPNRQPLGGVFVSQGKAAAGHRVFSFDNQSVAVSVDECPQVVAIDFGPGSDCFLIHLPGQASMDPRRTKKASARF